MASSTTASANLPSKKVAYLNYPLKTGCTFLNGAHVCVDASGYLQPAADTANFKYAGRFSDVDITTTGSDGAFTGKVTPPAIDRYQVFNATSPAVSWLNKIVSLVDDKSVALAATTTNDIAAGRVVEVYTTQVLVDTSDRAEPPVAA